MTLKLLSKILTIPAILIGFTFHEFAHAVVADRLGDKTPKFQGRLSLNPIVHVDPIGFIMILLFGFGWAKPVQVNPSAFKNYYKDDLKVSIAGPISNLIIAFIFGGIMFLMEKINPAYGGQVFGILYLIVDFTIRINCMLAFFNLMPLPGLDGFHILRDLFPSKFYKYADQIYRYQIVILVIFILTPLSTYLVWKPANITYGLILRLFS
ncbi:site-2 protease family protein [Clostridium cochlearium]|uniref:Metal dependent protease domain-containing protein n=1 Tax=Clostridium cochlearium TaxID=1494 RepID=A0A239ZJN8_CLOCO|nr:site-2 protease family protein [Clostridium cochlearium]MBV1821159.1 site-2 protease family protein [Bacteroidales bacterium MSK.15.36]MBE6063929.1 site-2 protease family protein [Clostridium cochlearium]MBU5269112.1 site-2 protease family protein [Clostridium cochlearium]MCG4571106.1 site-2 protease family protein [Clostridium cochlearium]MCR1971403.1 site-2 protease family protein [Clostridium cochlearium]